MPRCARPRRPPPSTHCEPGLQILSYYTHWMGRQVTSELWYLFPAGTVAIGAIVIFKARAAPDNLPLPFHLRAVVSLGFAHARHEFCAVRSLGRSALLAGFGPVPSPHPPARA